jgi:hypothetical protein
MFMVPAEDSAASADSAEAIESMMKFNAELAESGVLESLTGLHPPALGVRVAFGEGTTVESGVDVRDAVGAFWVLEVASHEDAVTLARRCPGQPGDVIELRRIQEIEESPTDGFGAGG